jgi:hypothetical protein
MGKAENDCLQTTVLRSRDELIQPLSLADFKIKEEFQVDYQGRWMTALEFAAGAKLKDFKERFMPDEADLDISKIKNYLQKTWQNTLAEDLMHKYDLEVMTEARIEGQPIHDLENIDSNSQLENVDNLSSLTTRAIQELGNSFTGDFSPNPGNQKDLLIQMDYSFSSHPFKNTNTGVPEKLTAPEMAANLSVHNTYIDGYAKQRFSQTDLKKINLLVPKMKDYNESIWDGDISLKDIQVSDLKINVLGLFKRENDKPSVYLNQDSPLNDITAFEFMQKQYPKIEFKRIKIK